MFPLIDTSRKQSVLKPSFLDITWQRLSDDGVSMFPVRFFYPAVDTKDAIFSRYPLNSDTWKFTSSILGLFSHFIPFTKCFTTAIVSRKLIKGQTTSIQTTLPLDTSHTYSYPIVILSQDYSGLDMEGMQMLCEEICKGGYVVISVKHTTSSPSLGNNPLGLYNPLNVQNKPSDTFPLTSLTLEPNADLQEMNRKNLEKRLDEHVDQLSFVMDKLLAIQYGQSLSIYGREDEDEGIEMQIFKGRLDLERIAVIGHSSSAAVAIKHACADRRIRAVIGLDAWMYPLSRDMFESGSACPLLLLQSGKTFFAADHHEYGVGNDEMARKIVSHTNYAYLYRLLYSKHYDILDLASFARIPMGILGLIGWKEYRKVDGQILDYKSVVVEYCREFLDKHVNIPTRSSVRTSSLSLGEKSKGSRNETTTEIARHDEELTLTPRSKRKINAQGVISNGYLRQEEKDEYHETDKVKRVWPLLDKGKSVFVDGIELERKGWQE